MRKRGSGWPGMALVFATVCTTVGTADPMVAAAPVPKATSNVWKVRDAIAPKGLDGSLWAESCSGPSFCMAVGLLGQEPIAEISNKGHWNLSFLPEPDGGQTADPTAVSCPSSDECVVVGDFGASDSVLPAGKPVDWLWNGHTFASSILATRPGASGGLMAAVSCASTTWCVAVGLGELASGDEPIADVWDGKRWHAAVPPALQSKSRYNALVAVQCGSFGCFALAGTLGGYVLVSGGPLASTLGALLYTWHETRWSVSHLPIPSGDTAEAFQPLSCPTSGFCMALVLINTPSGAENLADTWNGSQWTARPGPSLVGPGGLSLFTALSCATSNSCVAVGLSTADGPAAASWDGRSWKASKVLLPAGTTAADFGGVACSAPSRCVAVGRVYRPSETPAVLTLAEFWDGHSWRPQATLTLEERLPSSLSAVSCSELNACMTVGGPTGEPPVRQAVFSESWTRANWQVRPLPGQVVQLGADACATTDFCVVVGSQYGPHIAPLMDVWNGHSWSADKASSNANDEYQLQSVSCVSARECVAVGSFQSGTGGGGPAAYDWNGKSWRQMALPPALGSGPASISSVSCATSTSCEVVGSTANSSGQEVPLAASWNGKEWVVQHVPAAGASVLTAVSCLTPMGCVAVGSGHLDSGSMLLAYKFEDGEWTQQNIATPAGTVGQLSDVSCAAVTSCVAIGAEYHPGGLEGGEPIASLAEFWNGSTWAREPLPQPGALLNGVSCVAAGSCMVVGETEESAPLAATEDGFRKAA